MTEPAENSSQAGPLADALRRLNAAADMLEAAVAQSMEKQRSLRDQASELGTLADDRSRLAEELDLSNARAQALSVTGREVSRRLDQAMETVRAILEPLER